MERQWPGWLATRPAVAVDKYPGSQGTGLSWAADVPSSTRGEEEALFRHLAGKVMFAWASHNVSQTGADPVLRKIDRIGIYCDEKGIVTFMSVKERMQVKDAKAILALLFNHFSPEVQRWVDRSTHHFNTIDGQRIKRMVLVAEALADDEGPAVTVRPGPVECNLAFFDDASTSEETVALADQPSSSTSLVPYGPNVDQPSSSTSLVPYGPSVSTTLALPTVVTTLREPKSVALVAEAEGKLASARLEKERLDGKMQDMTKQLQDLDAKMLRSGHGRAWRYVVLKLLRQQEAENLHGLLREAAELTAVPLEQLHGRAHHEATQRLSAIEKVFKRHAADVPSDEVDLRNREVVILERLGLKEQQKIQQVQHDLDCTADRVVETTALVEERKKERDAEREVLQQRASRVTRVYFDTGRAPFYTIPKAKDEQVESFLVEEVQRRTKLSSDPKKLAMLSSDPEKLARAIGTVADVAYGLVRDRVLDETYWPHGDDANRKRNLVNLVEAAVGNLLFPRQADEDEEVKPNEETEEEKNARREAESKAHLAAHKEMRRECSTCAECLELDYMHGHLCATHASEFKERKKHASEVLLSDAVRAAAQMARGEERIPETLSAAAKSRPKKKTKGDNNALHKEALKQVNRCMNAMNAMHPCSQCGKEVLAPCEFLHYPTETWWKMEVPKNAPKEVLRFDATELGKTQFVFCVGDHSCENEWADTLQCRICGGTEWKRSQLPGLETHHPRRLLLEDEWRREAVKRGNMAKRQVQLGMIHPVRSRDPVLLRELEQCREQLYWTPNNEILAMEFKERRNAMGYTREEVEQRQAELYWEAVDETLAKLEAGSMKAKVLRAPICVKGCKGAAQSTMGPRRVEPPQAVPHLLAFADPLGS